MKISIYLSLFIRIMRGFLGIEHRGLNCVSYLVFLMRIMEVFMNGSYLASGDLSFIYLFLIMFSFIVIELNLFI